MEEFRDKVGERIEGNRGFIKVGEGSEISRFNVSEGPGIKVRSGERIRNLYIFRFYSSSKSRVCKLCLYKMEATMVTIVISSY